MVPYEYRYLREYKYRLALTYSIRSTSTYAPEITVFLDSIIFYVYNATSSDASEVLKQL